MAPRATPTDLLGYAMGTPRFLGVIVATTTKNNNDTTVPFLNTGIAGNILGTNLSGKVLLIQPDAACYISAGTSSTATATTASGVKLLADERVIIAMGDSYGWLACVSSTGTTNCRVWELI